MKDLSKAVYNLAIDRNSTNFNALQLLVASAVNECMKDKNARSTIAIINSVVLNITSTDGVIGQILGGTHAGLNKVSNDIKQANETHINRIAFAKSAYICFSLAAAFTIAYRKENVITFFSFMFATSLPLFPIFRAINSNKERSINSSNKELQLMFSEDALRSIISTEVSKASVQRAIGN